MTCPVHVNFDNDRTNRFRGTFSKYNRTSAHYYVHGSFLFDYVRSITYNQWIPASIHRIDNKTMPKKTRHEHTQPVHPSIRHPDTPCAKRTHRLAVKWTKTHKMDSQKTRTMLPHLLSLWQTTTAMDREVPVIVRIEYHGWFESPSPPVEDFDGESKRMPGWTMHSVPAVQSVAVCLCPFLRAVPTWSKHDSRMTTMMMIHMPDYHQHHDSSTLAWYFGPFLSIWDIHTEDIVIESFLRPRLEGMRVTSELVEIEYVSKDHCFPVVWRPHFDFRWDIPWYDDTWTKWVHVEWLSLSMPWHVMDVRLAVVLPMIWVSSKDVPWLYAVEILVAVAKSNIAGLSRRSRYHWKCTSPMVRFGILVQFRKIDNVFPHSYPFWIRHCRRQFVRLCGENLQCSSLHDDSQVRSLFVFLPSQSSLVEISVEIPFRVEMHAPTVLPK